MTAEERLAELGQILAVGFLRVRYHPRDKKSQIGSKIGDVSLDLLAQGSSHGSTQILRREQL